MRNLEQQVTAQPAPEYCVWWLCHPN